MLVQVLRELLQQGSDEDAEDQRGQGSHSVAAGGRCSHCMFSKKNSPIISSIICHRRMWDWVWMDNILAGYKKFEFSDTSLRSIISVIIFVWMPEETC